MRISNSRRQTWTWTVVCSCLSMWAASNTWGDEATKPGTGLSGLLPTNPPPGLTDEDFKQLNESIDSTWKTWITETGSVVKDLYEGSHPTIESQQAAIERVKVKLQTIEKAMADPRYESIMPELTTLYSRLSPEVTIVDAILNSLAQGPAEARKLKLAPSFTALNQTAKALLVDLEQYQNADVWVKWGQLKDLESLTSESKGAFETVAAIKNKLEQRETYAPEVKEFVSREPFLKLEDALSGVLKATNEGNTFDTAALRQSYARLLDELARYQDSPNIELEGEIRKTLDLLRTQAPDGGTAIVGALGGQYLNYNLRLYVSEGMINNFFQQTRLQNTSINERMMEATVHGYQCAQVTSTLDLVPNSLAASFRLNLSGVIRSNANGYTSEATIRTVGYHTFSAVKPVTFDGQTFSLQPGYVSANANNQPVGATTKFSRVPLIGRMANNVAMREASSRTPQANAMTVQRIRQQVGAQLEQEASSQFDSASLQLQSKLYAPLRKYNLYPDAMTFSTTDNQLMVSSRLMGPAELGGSRPVPVPQTPANGMVAQIHESLLTHAFDRLGLNGKTMSETEVRELLESRLTEILNRKVTFSDAPPQDTDAAVSGTKLMFDEKDPVRFVISDGSVTILIRAGLKREGSEDIPTQLISVPFTPRLEAGKVILTRGTVGVKPVVKAPNVAAQVARANVMRQKIQSSLPERTLNGTFNVTAQNRTVQLTVVNVLSEGGWLQIELQ